MNYVMHSYLKIGLQLYLFMDKFFLTINKSVTPTHACNKRKATLGIS